MDTILPSTRSGLQFVGFLIECLDASKNPIKNAVATGFIRREGGRLYLYTCWHVVTGFDPTDVKVGFALPARRYIRLVLEGGTTERNLKFGGTSHKVGGLQTLTLDLYDEYADPPRTRWLQDTVHVPHADLNAVGLFVPYYHDAVKIELPADLQVSDLQVIGEDRTLPSGAYSCLPGEKCLVVGYPYGYRAFGAKRPIPVVLTRFFASIRGGEAFQRVLLESPAAPGMSGGPVFVESESNLLLMGIYTGTIYPDYAANSNEKTTALGVVNFLTSIFDGGQLLVPRPFWEINYSGRIVPIIP